MSLKLADLLYDPNVDIQKLKKTEIGKLSDLADAITANPGSVCYERAKAAGSTNKTKGDGLEMVPKGSRTSGKQMEADG